jgi:hypothetical protein
LKSNFGTSSTTIVSQPTPADAQIKFKIYPPESLSGDIIYYKVYLTIQNPDGAPIGEIHTANQTGKYSFAPETINVLNGDQIIKSIGAIYKTDGDTLTKDWYRKYASESALAEPLLSRKPLLRLAVEETQRMYSRPFVKFDGSIFGYFNPLSRFTINDLEGLFIPLQLTYDLQANKVKATLARINDNEIAQEYELQPDYGTTTKVLVK